MSTVTELKPVQGCMRVAFDDAPSLRIRKCHFAKLPLEEGDEIDPEEYVNRVASLQFADAYESALTSLDASARTASEIDRGLRMKGFVAPVAEAVVERLKENGLIDDQRLAARLAETQLTKPVGLYAMKRKLRAKGVSDEDAAEALESFDDDQQRAAAIQAARKLLRRYEELPTRECRGKLSQALARRGFSWDAVSAAVEAVLEEEP